jgi:histidinol-phosphate phosphatase family protein
MRPAVFLDRDGTVIVERHYLSDPEGVELLPGAAEALRALQRRGLPLVLITNQSPIGRGLFGPERLEAIHARLRELLAGAGVRLDGIYYCPHTPEEGCACRKPRSGLLERAARELDLDLARSFVIGDKGCDIDAGRRVGAMTILVRTGYGLELAAAGSHGADQTADDLPAAVPVIAERLEGWQEGLAGLDVVVLCGGRGTRLGPLTRATPKPLLPVAGRPFLLHVLRRLRREGARRILLAAGYLGEQFKSFVRDAARDLAGPGPEVLVEPEPLGTGGALRHAAEAVRTETFIAMNGDSWFAQPLAPVLQDHARAGRDATVVVIPTASVEGNTRAKGVWRVGAGGQLEGFETLAQAREGWVNAGLYVLDRQLVRGWPAGRFSLEEEFPRLLQGKAAGAFCSRHRLLDIGTPDCYARAAQAIDHGSLSTTGAE